MLEQLQPKEIFRWFEELSKIPRGSGNTEQVSQWCLSQITAMGLICKRDEVGNVYAYKAASPGYDGAKPVLLQGHVDMVCVSAPGACRDMAREGVELCTDGKRLWADGTTLGADNGIGVAMLLALLESWIRDGLALTPEELVAALEGVVNRSTAGTVWQTLREQGNWSWTP